MPYLDPESVAKARQMDVLEYLQRYDPSELIRKNKRYITKSHDSLVINNGKWFWFSHGIGGCSALDYLIYVKGMDFASAVRVLAQRDVFVEPKKRMMPEIQRKKLLLPEKNRDCRKVMQYLTSRGIAPKIVQDCVEAGLIYESLPYHSVIFIGRDERNIARYAAYRSTDGSRFLGDAAGSDKTYSFHLTGPKECRELHVFEAAIDLLSYATWREWEGKSYKETHLLSLAGVYPHCKKQNAVPKALQKYLELHPKIETVYLHLDNDQVGRKATETIKTALEKQKKVIDDSAPAGKDINDFLCLYLRWKGQEHAMSCLSEH